MTFCEITLANNKRLTLLVESAEDLASFARGLICLAGLDVDNEEDRRSSHVSLNAARRSKVPTFVAHDVHYGMCNAEEALRWEVLSSMRTLTTLGQEHEAKKRPGDDHFTAPAEVQAEMGELVSSHSPSSYAFLSADRAYRAEMMRTTSSLRETSQSVCRTSTPPFSAAPSVL